MYSILVLLFYFIAFSINKTWFLLIGGYDFAVVSDN